MRQTVLRVSAACALALSVAACNTTAERAGAGAVVGGVTGAAIGVAVGGGHGALVGGVVGAGTGAIVGAATTPPVPVGPRYVYDEVYPGCPDWRSRAVRSSSDTYTCLDERGNFRPRRGLLLPRYDFPQRPAYEAYPG